MFVGRLLLKLPSEVQLHAPPLLKPLVTLPSAIRCVARSDTCPGSILMFWMIVWNFLGVPAPGSVFLSVGSGVLCSLGVWGLSVSFLLVAFFDGNRTEATLHALCLDDRAGSSYSTGLDVEGVHVDHRFSVTF